MIKIIQQIKKGNIFLIKDEIKKLRKLVLHIHKFY